MYEKLGDWSEVLADELAAPYFKQLVQRVQQAYRTATVYPPRGQVFTAFLKTPYKQVRVVLLGQDPYHGPGQAQGMSFSVAPGMPIPPSLQNIYQELYDDLGIPPADTGYLGPWAEQGVLLLNSCLTVQRGRAGSHREFGWQRFTDAVIAKLGQRPEPIVFLLWGSDAGRKAPLIKGRQHLILRAPHPSPLSAFRGFFGCRHFSQTNAFLLQHYGRGIEWNLGRNKTAAEGDGPCNKSE